MHVYTVTYMFLMCYYLYNLFMVYRYTYIIVVPRGVYYPVLYCTVVVHRVRHTHVSTTSISATATGYIHTYMNVYTVVHLYVAH